MKLVLKLVLVIPFIFFIVGCTYKTVTLSGQVYDSTNSLPIENATVTDGNFGMKNSAITNENGYYSYETYCEEHIIEINAEGYKNTNETLLTPFLPSSQPLTLDIYLEPN